MSLSFNVAVCDEWNLLEEEKKNLERKSLYIIYFVNIL
jgi:hypothetical protein